MAWCQFIMNLESIDADVVEALLMQHGAHSVTLTDAGDDPVLEPAPGETPLWPDTRLTALFDTDARIEELRQMLQSSLQLDKLPPNRLEPLADREWEREWLKDFRPMQFGRRLWVVPGHAAPPPGDAVVLMLDPGLAFGTGTHATTALCLEWLDAIDLRDKNVLDFGCGSGILGVAALLLGARRVHAVDIDLQAVTATRQNAARNGVADRIQAATQLDESAQPFDVLVANILAGTLIDNAATICRMLRPGGLLALSGILAGQVDDVMSAFDGSIEFDDAIIMDGWARLSGARN